MRAWFLRQPNLTKNQLDRFSNIFDNAGQVIFGVVVLSPLIASFNRVNWLVEVCGIMTMIGSWMISVRLAKKE